jgi:membrane protein DedA with SNARE-associated domain
MEFFDIENIIITLGYLGIFLMMITNGITSFPSSQVLYIITGYFISTGDLSLPAVIVVGTIGNTIGCIALYEITRSKGLKYISKFKLFPEKEMKKVAVALRKKGVWFLFIGKLLPAIKVFVPVAAGIGKTRRDVYTILMFISSALWTIPFISIGYVFGKSSDVFGKYAIVLAIVAIIVGGLFYKYINSKEVLKEIEN